MCDFCNNESLDLTEFEYYITPFNSIPESVSLCQKCLDNIDNIYYCEVCNRHISYNSGYRINLRYNKKSELFECVECLQKEWLEKGMENFKQADFFDYSDLSNNGFNEFDSYFCRSKQSYIDVEHKFTELQQDNYVIVNIKASGLGFEHHISLYIKNRE